MAISSPLCLRSICNRVLRDLMRRIWPFPGHFPRKALLFIQNSAPFVKSNEPRSPGAAAFKSIFAAARPRAASLAPAGQFTFCTWRKYFDPHAGGAHISARFGGPAKAVLLWGKEKQTERCSLSPQAEANGVQLVLTRCGGSKGGGRSPLFIYPAGTPRPAAPCPSGTPGRRRWTQPKRRLRRKKRGCVEEAARLAAPAGAGNRPAATVDRRRLGVLLIQQTRHAGQLFAL